ncbi:LamG domain-containing protein [Parapedobacter koreensis]|uniref:Concanavalin A-like lectin/glucanases superfamily protein n=1 Tax=Parapedobacter koreensis TaxID=332977 RepID=A0A1H7GSH4_9SPHI|nr:LamG domain-containing protein [Parapedobacter koreensis]SEK40984.1 Concanavalin A-like lectin/glucanases superfamily protein [Parapedobacter koreensis]
MKTTLSQTLAALGLAVLIAASSCQKMDRPPMNIIPDDTARINGPLQFYAPFEDSPDDSAQYQKGSATAITFVDGVTGKAYKGASNGQIQYPSAVRMANMTSFTVSFWMNTEKHDGGAQAIFMLPNTEDFWGNLFATIEGNNNPDDNSMLLKFNFAGNWVEFNGNNGLERLPDMYGRWRHLAFTYDESTSKFAAYLDGEPLALPAAVTDRVKDGAPLGPLAFSNVSRFVIGGYQQHIGIRTPADAWMLHYTGMLDQFRVHTRALSATEIAELYTTRQ